jgi:hypothetical protein
MKRQENSIKTIWRYLFRGIGIVFLIGLVQAVALFFHTGCRLNSDAREREERIRLEAKRRYERERAEAIRNGTNTNSAIKKLNSGKWLPEGKQAPK